MMLVQQIKKKVAELPEMQFKEFRAWFEEFDASKWDKQFEKDVELRENLMRLPTERCRISKKGDLRSYESLHIPFFLERIRKASEIYSGIGR